MFQSFVKTSYWVLFVNLHFMTSFFLIKRGLTLTGHLNVQIKVIFIITLPQYPTLDINFVVVRFYM